MAIGLGRLLGFHFPENFNQPYRSTSITEFWRRWHMTLSRWFRDYLYIPLGGNRRGELRTFLNLWLVFFLCGLWHGAGLTFIVWGFYHGFLLVFERIGVGSKWIAVLPRIARSLLCFCAVMIGWVFFRAVSLSAAWSYLHAMFGAGAASSAVAWKSYLSRDVLVFMGLGTVLAFAPIEGARQLQFDSPTRIAMQLTVASFSLFYSLTLLAANGFNPFIYFRF